MNKETKVGLLVGLSFIVLFGVILSNHAPEIVSPPERPMLAPTQPRGTADQVIRQIGTTTAPPPEPVDVIADATLQHPQATPAKTDDRPAGTDSRSADTAVADATPAARNATALADATAPPEENAPRTITADDLGPETAEAKPDDEGMELLSSKVAPDGTRTTVYIVKSGDCLAKIAREFYGDASNRNIDKIYEANKARMPNKRTLAVGTKLEVPVKAPSKDTGTQDLLASGKFDQVAELKSTRGAGDTKAKDAPPASANDPRKTPARTTVTEVSQEVLDNITKDADRKPADKAPDKAALVSAGKCRHYQIQKGDTWYGLAARFMGDGKRWHDLYALNDDILPDATKLRTGVKIRVPVGAKDRLDSVME